MKNTTISKKFGRKALLTALCAAAVICAGAALGTASHTQPVSAETADTKTSFYVYGAAVRQIDDTYGMGVKFHVLMSDELYSALGVGTNVQTGVLVVPTELIEGESLTVTEETAVNKATTNFWFDSELQEGYKESVAYVYDIPQSNFGTDISIVGYYVENGSYTYTAEKTASLAEVALAAEEEGGDAYADYYTFTLTYNDGEGVSVTYGDSLTEPDAPEAQFGQIFEGWYNQAGTDAWDYENGTVTGDIALYAKFRTVISGSGTEADPYLILNNEGFAYFTQAVNGGESFEDKYFKLDADITDVSTMVGTSNTVYFKGNFDGNGKSVTVKIENTTTGTALFLYNAGTMENLTVKGSVTGTASVAGIAAYNDGVITDCSNEATVNGTTTVAGITANNRATVENCINKGAVTSDSTSTAASSATEGYQIGGIVGLNGSGSLSGTVSGCTNEGEITGVGGISSNSTVYNGGVGGIAGVNYSSAKNNVISVIQNSTNKGTVNAYFYFGGIVGIVYDLGTFENCTNEGAVIGRALTASNASYYAGGVAGYLYGGVATSCVNLGNVSAGANVGGIAGYAYGTSYVTDCTNGRAASDEEEAVAPVISGFGGNGVAGIIGYWNSAAQTAPTTVSGCVNYGTVTLGEGVTAAAHYGGIIGMCGNYHVIDNCTNYGAVTGVGTATTGVGGIVGTTYAGDEVKNCANYGKVTGTTGVGQIIGYNKDGATTPENCTEGYSESDENESA